ncbi:MAG: OmpA family protein [Chlorobiaceae bacterium]|nr:OmpA family protein [Chlorobiaceae bacterium]
MAPKPVPQYVISDIYFDTKVSLVNTEAEAQMKNNVEWLAAHPGKVLVLEGHTDERGVAAVNMKLGMARAEQARNIMIKLGADPKRIEVVSKGETDPLDKGHNDAAWAKNRRVHVLVK